MKKGLSILMMLLVCSGSVLVGMQGGDVPPAPPFPQDGGEMNLTPRERELARQNANLVKVLDQWQKSRRNQDNSNYRWDRDKNFGDPYYRFYGGKDGKASVDAAVSARLTKYWLEYMMDETREGSFKQCLERVQRDAAGRVVFDDNGMPLKKEPDYMRAGLDAVWCSAMSGSMGGIIQFSNSMVSKALAGVYDIGYGGVSKAFNKAWNFVFHNGADSVSPTDLTRWSTMIGSMVEKLVKFAKKAKGSGGLGADLSMLNLSQFGQGGAGDQNPDGDQDGPKVPKRTVDKDWEESAVGFLNIITQIVKEIEARKRHYGPSDDMTFYLNSLIITLVGDKDKMFVDEESGKRIFGGGIYSRIAGAKSIADLAAARTVVTIQLLYGNVTALLQELLTRVNEKTSKEKEKQKKADNPFSNNHYGY